MKKVFSILALICCFISFAQNKKLNIVYIGDSITEGGWLDNAAEQSPPTKATAYLEQQAVIDTVAFSNQGHSGFTTVNFLPGTAAFTAIENAAIAFPDKSATLIFSIMLGTNDSAMEGTKGAPVSPESYYNNLKSIIEKLLMDFPHSKIIIHSPLWYSPNTYNGAKYLQAGLDRLQSYFSPIKNLVDSYKGKRVFLGDTAAFDYFKKNYLTKLRPEDGKQGTFYLHPNKDGAADLGIFWGKAIYVIALHP
jgi:lysophospholipase L1-like esterase